MTMYIIMTDWLFKMFKFKIIFWIFSMTNLKSENAYESAHRIREMYLLIISRLMSNEMTDFSKWKCIRSFSPWKIWKCIWERTQIWETRFLVLTLLDLLPCWDGNWTSQQTFSHLLFSIYYLLWQLWNYETQCTTRQQTIKYIIFIIYVTHTTLSWWLMKTISFICVRYPTAPHIIMLSSNSSPATCNCKLQFIYSSLW